MGDTLCPTETATALSNRAANYTLLLNPSTGFLAPRLANGDWAPDFDQYAWGDADGYTESGPWQYRLEVSLLLVFFMLLLLEDDGGSTN